MMFRSMGIPARYAEGYFVTKDDVEEEGNNYRKYSVKDSAAHAWVEIYEEGIGWVAVEVTPGMENFTIEKQELFTELTIQETQENSDDIETVTETLDTQTSQEISTSQTTFAQETGTEGGRQISSQAEKGKFVVRVLVVLGMAAGFLLRYQFVSSRHMTVNEFLTLFLLIMAFSFLGCKYLIVSFLVISLCAKIVNIFKQNVDYFAVYLPNTTVKIIGSRTKVNPASRRFICARITEITAPSTADFFLVLVIFNLIPFCYLQLILIHSENFLNRPSIVASCKFPGTTVFL